MRVWLLASSLAVAACFGLAAPLAFGDSSWPMPGHDAQSTNFNAGEHTLGVNTVGRVHRVWTYTGASRAIVAGNRVFALSRIGTSSGNLNIAVLDARTGRRLHLFTPAALRLQSGSKDQPLALAYAGGRLILGAAREVLAINPGSGHVLWRSSGGASGMTIVGGTIYTGTGCRIPCGARQSYALDLRSGKVMWAHTEGGWPVLIADRLYQSSGSGRQQTSVYDPKTGALIAQLPLNAFWTGDARGVYAAVTSASIGTSLERIASTGKPAWKVPLGHPQGASIPVLAYHTLFAQSNRFHPGIVAVAAATGKVVWAQDTGGNITLVGANHVLYALHQSSGRVDVMRTDTGKIVRSIQAPGYRQSGSWDEQVAGGSLYVMDGSRIIAMRP